MNKQVHIDLQCARSMLLDWTEAERAVMAGQEYRIGTRSLRRADLPHIAERIRFWMGEIKRLEGRPTSRVQQAVPRST